ncbi:MAG TPA: hypothetical protein VJT75_19055 [Thermoleophilaceae bacterium]|nr:hypothetical protein [Thermoleophilaceae bacterium]
MTLAFAVVISLATVAPAARAASGCHVPKHARVRASSRHIVAYTMASGGGARDLYACLDTDGRRVKAQTLEPEEWVTRAVAAGSKLAYAVIEQLPENHRYPRGYARVRLLDLRRRGDPETVGVLHSDVRLPVIRRIVLAPDGALAYSARWYWTDRFMDYVSPAHEVREVEAVDDLGYWQMAGGTDARIDLRSLERRGRRVAWTESGVRRSKRFRDLGRCTVPDGAWVRGHAEGVTVWELERTPGQYEGHACIADVGEDQLIRQAHPIGDGGFYRIGGRFVAWTGDDNHVGVYDLDGHRLLHDALGEAPRSEDCYTPPAIRDLAVSHEGDVAWTMEAAEPDDPCGDEPARHVVTAVDACGRIELDDDPSVGLWSLRIAGRRVIWDSGTEERSAELRSAGDC